jgi:diguanylate cyclase (GGDEF)-like protein
MAVCQRSGKLLAVCFMDLDGFKQINDKFGHEVGDDLLRQVAGRLQSLLRGSDTVARLGGDEFVILLSGLESEDECSQALDRLLTIVSQPYALGRDTLSEIGASIGVTLHPADSADADTLLRHADQAMYAAKQAGKNCYQLFDARMEQRLQARHDTLRRVARGLSAGQFQLHYQPKVNCHNGTVTGVEALIRWQHPVLGSLTPNEFLPLLEDDDLALSLGEWVVREALRQGRVWAAQGSPLPISVNVFPRQLQRPSFADVVAQAIDETWPTMSPGLLTIEIVESAALNELEAVQAAIQRCRALGIGFSLDDFGTGYSSLSYLRCAGPDFSGHEFGVKPCQEKGAWNAE